MLGGIGINELLIVLLIGLILFGGKRLPELARGVGRSILDFRSALHEQPADDLDLPDKTSR